MLERITPTAQRAHSELEMNSFKSELSKFLTSLSLSLLFNLQGKK